MKIDIKIEKAVKEWNDYCQSLLDNYFSSMFPNLEVPEIKFTIGRRYIKVIREEYHGGSNVWAFIDKNTGDIYKPSSWRAPAKHIRGNVLNEDGGKSCVTCHGVKYLK